MQTTHFSQFLQIPTEIIISIIKDLSFHDILRLSETCQLLHNVVQTSASIQYQIEKEIAGVVHGDSLLSTADRLALLKKTEYNWATLRFSRVEKTKSRQGNLWELFGGVLAFSHGLPNYGGLDFIELPSAFCGTALKTHRLTNLGDNIRDFGMDPSQDLLIIVETTQAATKYLATMKLLTMSTGQEHPLATRSTLACRERPPFMQYSFILQVMGDYLGVILHTNTMQVEVDDQFYLWNWKTGCKVLRLNPSLNDIRYDSFSFISPTHFVVSRFQQVHDSEADISPCLEIYEFPVFSDRTIVDPEPYRTFQLPQLSQGVIPWSITTRSDPSPGCPAVPVKGSPSRPFTTSPKSRLLTICAELIDPGRGLQSYVMFFVHQDSLLSMPESLLFSKNIYEWQHWGPQYSRCLQLENDRHTVWVCYVHGTRFVHSVVENGITLEPRARHLQVLDFNPLSIKRYGCYGEQNVEIVDGKTVIPKHRRIFSEDVTTTLPYRQSTSIKPCQNADFMIDEGVIIELRRSAPVSETMDRDVLFLSL